MAVGITNKTGKKSFVLYTDTKELWESLSDVQAGKLIKHIYSYAAGDDPNPPDDMTRLLSIQIKKALDRDQNKWEAVKEARSKSGKKGGRPPKAKKAIGFDEKQSEANKANSYQEKQGKANKAVSVNANDNATVNENENEIVDEELYDVDILYRKYLAKDKLIKAVKEKMGINDRSILENRLLKFTNHLKTKDQFKKTWKDYTEHFLSWHNKSPQLQNSSTPSFNSPVI